MPGFPGRLGPQRSLAFMLFLTGANGHQSRTGGVPQQTEKAVMQGKTEQGTADHISTANGQAQHLHQKNRAHHPWEEQTAKAITQDCCFGFITSLRKVCLFVCFTWSRLISLSYLFISLRKETDPLVLHQHTHTIL